MYSLNEGGKFCYVLIYVDDLLVASEFEELLLLCEHTLDSKFEIKNLGEIRNYLGLRIDRNSDGNFAINQETYIMRVANNFGLANVKSSDVPLNPSYGKGAESDLLPSNDGYRQLIGCLLYISVSTRPDVSASVSILAQKVAGPNQEDWNGAKRIVKYLKGTAGLSLLLGVTCGQAALVGYADTNWAESRIDRKSNSGFIFRLFDGTVSWTCKRQTCVALSSTEAEFIALSDACREVLWIRRIMMDFNVNLDGPTTIYEDNQSCLKLIEEEKLSNRSKHIDVRYHFVKDYVEKNIVFCVYCPTETMLADLLTKPLCAKRLQQLRLECGLDGV